MNVTSKKFFGGHASDKNTFIVTVLPFGPNLIRAMGVYVMIRTTRPWIKVGHHRITPRRPTLDHRLRRGFKSCIHPADLAGRLEKSHFRIVGWFPTLGLLDERRAHLICSGSVGEFHPARDLPRVLRLLRSRTAVSK